ncbi:Na+/H+ antiporter subunit E [Thiohalocapsa halophila]
MADATRPPTTASPLRWTVRLVLFALVWLMLAGTDPVSWIIGVPAVLLATFAAARLSTLVGADPSPLRLVAFVPFFVWESILGGVDVARRVLSPRLRIDPALIGYRPRLQDAAAKVVFLDTISLLPGTLSADIRDGIIQVHALDADPSVVAGLVGLEQRVARLFGETLAGAPQVTVTSCEREDALALARAEAAAVAQAQTRAEGGDA